MKVLARDIRIYLGLPPHSQKAFIRAGIGRIAKDRELTDVEVRLVIEAFRSTEGNRLIAAALPTVTTPTFAKKPDPST